MWHIFTSEFILKLLKFSEFNSRIFSIKVGNQLSARLICWGRQRSRRSVFWQLVEAAKEGIWLNRLYLDIFPNSEAKIVLLEDNQSTINIATNEIINERSKHIEVWYHFMRQYVNEGKIKLEYCPTQDMVEMLLCCVVCSMFMWYGRWSRLTRGTRKNL